MTQHSFVVDAVLFDLDGTLIDTVEDIAQSANRMLAELERPPRSVREICSFVGKGIPNLVMRCMTEGTVATEGEIETAIDVFHRHYAEINGRHAVVYPGVVEVLKALLDMQLPLACVTNKAEAFTLPLLERVGLADFFTTVVSGDTLAVKKPDPAMLQLAVERLDARQPLMIGDSENDALAARAAGMPVLLVSWGYSEGRPVDTLDSDGLLFDANDVLDCIVPAA